MPQDFSRAERVGDTLQRELANLIQQEIRDPRVGMANINAVRVSQDLGRARIFVTFVEKTDQQSINKSLSVLNKAAGFLRSKLHARMTMRVIPKLHFEYDESIMRAAHMTQLIDSALQSDRDMKTGSDEANDSAATSDKLSDKEQH